MQKRVRFYSNRDYIKILIRKNETPFTKCLIKIIYSIHNVCVKEFVTVYESSVFYPYQKIFCGVSVISQVCNDVTSLFKPSKMWQGCIQFFNIVAASLAAIYMYISSPVERTTCPVIKSPI